MSKFLITNIGGGKSLTPNNMEVNCAFDLGWIKGKVFDKKCQHSKNYCWDANGGAFVVGTPLLKNINNIAEYIYRDFTEDKISQYKREIIGMWAVFVYKDGKAFCFNDYWGLYDICYKCTVNNTFVLSTSLADVHVNFPDASIDEFSFVMENFQLGTFPGDTIFKEIKRLKKEQYIEITESRFSVEEIHHYRFSYTFKSKEQAIQDIISYAKDISVMISKRFGKTAVAMTGGLDSRLVFSILDSAPNSDITLVHGIGSSTENEDREIAENIANYYHKNFVLEDWKNKKGFVIEDQYNTFKTVGYYNFVGLGSKQCYDEYERIANNYSFYQAGYFCEALRLREWAERKNSSTFSLVDYVDNYYINKKLQNCYSNYEDYRCYLLEKYREQLKEIDYNGDEEKIPMDYFERFRWIMSRFCDSRSVMMLNTYHFTFPIMSTPIIHEIVLSLPADIIKGGGFQIELVTAINKELIENFGLHSHRRSYRIMNGKKIPLLTLKNIADFCFTIFPFIKPVMLSIYRNINNQSNEKRNLLLDDIRQIQSNYPSFVELTKFSGSLVRLRATLVGLSYIQNQLGFRR